MLAIRRSFGEVVGKCPMADRYNLLWFARMLYMCFLPGKNGIADWLIKTFSKTTETNSHSCIDYKGIYDL